MMNVSVDGRIGIEWKPECGLCHIGFIMDMPNRVSLFHLFEGRLRDGNGHGERMNKSG